MPGRVESLNKIVAKPSFAVLIDPEKEQDENALLGKIDLINQSQCAMVLIGASADACTNFSEVSKTIQNHCNKPLIGFPGGAHQVNEFLDGLLFISLISSSNAKYLFEEQSKAIDIIDHIPSLGVYPTGYMLLDGGKASSVERVSSSKGLAYSNVKEILTRAKTARYLGMNHLYLEAGSGALERIPTELVEVVAKEMDGFLIVGGGISQADQVSEYWEAGAKLVVVGNAIERNPVLISEISLKCQMQNELEQR